MLDSQFGMRSACAMVVVAATFAASGPVPAASGQEALSATHAGPSAALTALAALDQQQRHNAHIEIEPAGWISPEDRAVALQAGSLWNAGRHDAALALLQAMSNPHAAAISVAWLEPAESDAGGIAGFGDVTINTEDATGSIALDVNAANGALYCVAQAADGWRLYRSSNGGQTWTNPYSWFGAQGAVDVDAAIVGGFVYIGYVESGDDSRLRVRRASATTGGIDTVYSFQVAHDAAPATIEEVAAAANTDDGNTNIYIAALESNDTVGYHWDSAADGTTWTEIAVGVLNAERGLDMTYNPGDGTYFLYISYIASDNSVRVARRQSGVGWSVQVIQAAYTGSIGRTSISAWEDTVIVAYRHAYANGQGLRYEISYEAGGGGTWLFGSPYVPGAGDHSLINFDVCARGGFGVATTYVLETGGEPDEVWFRKRSGYGPTVWDDPVQINNIDVFTSSAIEPELNWIAPVDGNQHNYRFGIVFPQPNPIFDRRQHCDGDVNESGAVDIDDLLAVVGAWGACADCSAGCSGDIDPFFGDCVVNINDLLEVIAFWGPCP